MASPASRAEPTTAADLLRLPDDGYRYELVAGQLVRGGPAGGRHGLVARHLGQLLWSWAQRERTGVVCAAETRFKMCADPDTVRAPDVSFVARKSIPAHGVPDGFWEGPPDLAVELLSPNDRMVDVLAKVGEYLDAGCRQVWIVAPKSSTVTVYRSRQEVRVLTQDDTLVGTEPVEGFECDLGELFA